MSKRVLALLLAFIMLFSLAACNSSSDNNNNGGNNNVGDNNNDNNNDENTNQFGMKLKNEYDATKFNEPGTFPIFKDKKVITVQLPASAYVEDFNTNFQTYMLEERLNADLQIEAIPSKEYKTKINLMVASDGDDMADAVLGSFTDSEVFSWAQNGAIAPVTEYYYNTAIAYYLHDALNRLGWNFFPQVTMPDGEIYGVAQINESISNAYPDKLYVYKPWADKLGINLDKIDTVDDFKNMLRAIKNGDPNGNGQADEIPLTAASSNKSWWKYIMNAFVYAGGRDYMVLKNGEISFAYTTEAWREGLRFIKSLIDEGLVPSFTFSQDSAAMTALLNNETTVVGSMITVGTGSINAADPRRVEYYGVAPLKNKEGVRVGSYDAPAASTRAIFRKNNPDLEYAFRFCDLMVSREISIHARWGENGVDHLNPGPNDKSMYDSLGYPPVLIEVTPWSILQNKHWYQTGPYIREKGISAGVVWSGNPLDHNLVIAQAQIKYEGTAPKEYVQKLIYTAEEAEVTEILAQLKSYVEECLALFATGEMDLDKDWDKYLDQLEQIGYEKALDIAQAAYDRMYK